MNVTSTVAAVFLVTLVLILIICFVARNTLKNRLHSDIDKEINQSLERYYQIQNTKISVMDRDSELAPNHA